MLSYDDSKRLKELGYPQELEVGDWAYSIGTGEAHGWRKDEWSENEPYLMLYNGTDEYGLDPELPYVKVPTTDGMIEGLGEQFQELERDEYGNFRAWSAKPRKWTEWRLKNGMEQALCELWKKVKG